MPELWSCKKIRDLENELEEERKEKEECKDLLEKACKKIQGAQRNSKALTILPERVDP